MAKLAFRRVLLKLSGEAFAGISGFGLDEKQLKLIADEVGKAQKLGVELAVVVGAGNYFRGAREAGGFFDRVSADYLGMLATLINGVALKKSLERVRVFSRVLSSFEIPEISEPYERAKAIEYLERGDVIILTAGTGNPFFTTDTAAALRALELDASVLLKATKVDGVYDSDPAKNPDAHFFASLSYNEVLSKELGVMDATAICLCREHKLPIVVFNFFRTGNIAKVVQGKGVGTRIC